jgi:hypothetical protein
LSYIFTFAVKVAWSCFSVFATALFRAWYYGSVHDNLVIVARLSLPERVRSLSSYERTGFFRLLYLADPSRININSLANYGLNSPSRRVGISGFFFVTSGVLDRSIE